MKSSIVCTSFALLSAGLMAQAPSGKNVSGPDRAFAIRVAETDLAELKISNMALEKSSSDKVKKIAQKLIEDHTKTSDAMKEIASAKGLPLPKEPDAMHKMLAKKLEMESGAQFDKDYLKANTDDHHKVVMAFEKEASSGNDPEIKEFANKFLPAIKEHTAMLDSAM